MINSLLVGLGGAIGSILRYLIGHIHVSEIFMFPIKTFLMHISGCFLIGLIVAIAVKHNVSEKAMLFLKIGFCGGFTTFSTFSLETAHLLKHGHYFVGILYIFLSLLVGICVIFLADFIVHKF